MEFYRDSTSNAIALKHWEGLCFIYTTRRSGEAQIYPYPSESVCQPAADASSR